MRREGAGNDGEQAKTCPTRSPGPRLGRLPNTGRHHSHKLGFEAFTHTMDPNQQYQQQYHQQQQAGFDVNPYYKPYQGPSYPIAGSSSSHSAPVPANAYEYDVGILAQQSVYVPGAMIDKRGGAGGKLAKGGKRTTVLRKGGGKVWEDQTLLEWNPCEFYFHSSVLLFTDNQLELGSGSLWGISATTSRTMFFPMHSTNTHPSRRPVSSGTD